MLNGNNYISLPLPFAQNASSTAMKGFTLTLVDSGFHFLSVQIVSSIKRTFSYYVCIVCNNTYNDLLISANYCNTHK